MAHLWHFDGSAWIRLSLDRAFLGIGRPPANRVRSTDTLPARGAVAALGRYASPGAPDSWVLLASPSARICVNGQPPAAGFALLRDRDELLVAGATRLYFSTEEQPKVVPFPGSDEPVVCARCRQPIRPGSPAVCCPSCSHWCEESGEKPCWSYARTCPACDQPTAFDGPPRWTPDDD